MAADGQDPKIGAALQEVTQRFQAIVKGEIELFKVEMTVKAKRFAAGAVAGVVGGVFFLTALSFLLQGLAWLIWDVFFTSSDAEDDIYAGFLIMSLLLAILGGIAALLAMRLVKKALPPTPQLTIEEAQRVKATVQGDPIPSVPQRSTS